MRPLLAFLLLLYAACGLAAPTWLIASADAKAQAGAYFDLVVTAPGVEPLPEELSLRLRSGAEERIVAAKAIDAEADRRRTYRALMPPRVEGPVSIGLVGLESSTLIVMVSPEPDALAGFASRPQAGEPEPPLSQNDPMYFVVGGRDGYTARFQLSFKYRLFDVGTGLGREQPWLAGLYFGYTQNSIWDLSSESKPLRDTSYRPSLFWRWERSDEKTFIDGVRLGYEHESNGRDGDRSRSIDTLFVRPEWIWRFSGERRLEFTPKFYGYLDKEENPDIHHYRGYVDWRVRYDAAGEWITTAVVRRGTEGKGSLLVDLSRRARDLRFGPVGGYLHLQFFTGYGDDILGYNVKRESQLRIGFAIVP